MVLPPLCTNMASLYAPVAVESAIVAVPPLNFIVPASTVMVLKVLVPFTTSVPSPFLYVRSVSVSPVCVSVVPVGTVNVLAYATGNRDTAMAKDNQQAPQSLKFPILFISHSPFPCQVSMPPTQATLSYMAVFYHNHPHLCQMHRLKKRLFRYKCGCDFVAEAADVASDSDCRHLPADNSTVAFH